MYVVCLLCYMQLIQPVGGTWSQRGSDGKVTITCTFPAGWQNVSACFTF